MYKNIKRLPIASTLSVIPLLSATSLGVMLFASLSARLYPRLIKATKSAPAMDQFQNHRSHFLVCHKLSNQKLSAQLRTIRN